MSVSSQATDPVDGDNDTSIAGQDSELASIVRPYSHSPLPAYGLGSLFLASILIPAQAHRVGAHIAPFLQRVGFGAAFSMAGYALSCGDKRNGSGIATSTSLVYLMLHLRKSLTAPRSPASLVLTSGVLATTALYGSEYFLLQPF
ncbi:hypothetical protein NEOLEDRAFT_1128288 [Neolentinus lepideus HHB14362 ss-1]|uniref:Uncharacterized protein n=1 Tax=Neolentinus lepideus HHB14362 ss-1 TaxID=1314782 RepID=A0A165VDJ7_9AGAM|nr:hypothetical protein NEOLEDRAFT_1128288 [Neolentinus lepideus HHB14362 ss-1]